MRHATWLAVAVAVCAPLLAGCEDDAHPRRAAEPGGETASLVGKKVLMVFASKNFRDEELAVPRAVLTRAGAAVTLASSTLEEATGMLGAKATADVLLEKADVGEYDAVVFIGGSGAREYFADPSAHALARSAAAGGKVVGAICVAPSILANAGVLEGRRATCFSSQAATLRAKGAAYTGDAVTVDGRLVTAEGPRAAQQFADALIQALGK